MQLTRFENQIGRAIVALTRFGGKLIYFRTCTQEAVTLPFCKTSQKRPNTIKRNFRFEIVRVFVLALCVGSPAARDNTLTAWLMKPERYLPSQGLFNYLYSEELHPIHHIDHYFFKIHLNIVLPSPVFFHIVSIVT